MQRSARLVQAGGIVVSIVAAVLAAGCGAGAGQPPSTQAAGPEPTGTATNSVSASPTVTPTRWPLVLPVPKARPGLHQTGTRPPAASPMFRAEMVDLWAGVVSGRPRLAMPAFFPLVAYEQVKAIADPAADWHNRLVAEYLDDILAAHALLGGGARRARLIRVIVPESEAGWINPGVCDNGIGYWHVANARLVYRVAGVVRSFGLSTLISWRGHWYVVHMGGELRSGSGGMVDQPSLGPGTPGPPGGC